MKRPVSCQAHTRITRPVLIYIAPWLWVPGTADGYRCEHRTRHRSRKCPQHRYA